MLPLSRPLLQRVYGSTRFQIQGGCSPLMCMFTTERLGQCMSHQFSNAVTRQECHPQSFAWLICVRGHVAHIGRNKVDVDIGTNMQRLGINDMVHQIIDCKFASRLQTCNAACQRPVSTAQLGTRHRQLRVRCWFYPRVP